MSSRASGLRRSGTWLLLVVAALPCGSTDRGSAAAASAPPPTAPAAAPPTTDALLDREGALEASDTRGTFSFIDRYDVPVSAGEHVRVVVTSSAFDPVLEVTPPSGVPLTNDDHRGDRTRSELELVATVAGHLKVQVTSFSPSAQGAYHVRVERVAARPAPQPALAAAPPVRRHHVLSSLSRPPQGVAPGTPPPAAGGSAAPVAIELGGRATGTLAAGDTQLEIIAPVRGERLYTDFLERCGPGLHHVCREAADDEAFEAAVRGAEEAGATVIADGVMAGGMRFAYVTAEDAGVPYIEIACLTDDIRTFFDYVKQEQQP